MAATKEAKHPAGQTDAYTSRLSLGCSTVSMLATFVSDYPLPQALWTTTGDASEMRSDPLAISKMDSPSAGESSTALLCLGPMQCVL